MTLEESKQKKIERYLNAVACKEVDYTPVHLNGSVAICRTIDPSIRPGDLYKDPARCIDVYLKACEALDPEQIGACEYPLFMRMMARMGLGDCKLPGDELPMEAYWQMEEFDWFKPEYYDIVAEGGLKAFEELRANYVPPTTGEIWGGMAMQGQMFAEKFAKSSLPRIIEGPPAINGYLQYLNFSRGYGQFLRDLRKIPDKVVAASNRMDDDIYANMIIPSLMQKPERMETYVVRCDQDAISFKTFEKYIWPFYLRIQEQIDKYSPDTILTYHIDGNYTDFFVNLADQLRPEKTILQFDGFADPVQLAPALTKNKICFYGDIPPSMMTLGTPDQVRDRVKMLQDLFGNGLIVASGCCIPPDSKAENIRAMVDTAHRR